MRKLLTIALALGTAAAALAQTPSAQTPPDREPTTSDPVIRAREDAIRAAFATMPDTPGTGPYKAIKEVDPALPTHTVYRPANLTAAGKLGVIIWGQGGCRADGAAPRQHLAELASYGYVAIAPGTPKTGPSTANATELGKSTTQDVLAGLDWILKENGRKGSRYYGRIDPKLVGASGTSCGGLQAIQAAADPRVHAAVFHNTGIFPDERNPNTGMPADKSLLAKLHTPVIYILGGPSDVAFPNGTDDFKRITDVPAVLAWTNVGHGGTLREKNGGAVATVARDWFQWQLRGDKAAAKTFVGTDCGLCREPGWTIERKGI